jgi:hypothetical protein
MPEKKEVDDLFKKYSEKLNKELGTDEGSAISSREYREFKESYLKKPMTFYEKACNFSERLIKLNLDKKKEKIFRQNIDIAHLQITPGGAIAFSFIFPIFLIIGGIFLTLIVSTLTGAEVSFFFILFFILAGVITIMPLQKMPDFLANSWRLKASNQMVLCVFYIVTYMRHTSNLELAINFSAEHLAPPLSLDLKKIMWNVETSKFESIKESLDNYLETWRKWNMEFIESMHLIEASLYEGSEERRLNSLDKALSTILDETYEKMLHYAHNLKSPITVLHMIGIIMPILGLVILPLLINFVEGVMWYHISMLYNVILPIIVFYMGKTILSQRPTGYGKADISEENPELKKYKNIIINISGKEVQIKPIYIAIMIGLVLFIIGISPLIIQMIDTSIDPSLGSFGKLFDFKDRGPYGIGATILSLSVTLSFGVGIGYYFKLRSQNVIKIRERAKKLEEEIAASIFQLGNRIGDGIPAEIAFGKVAEIMEGTYSGSFFLTVSEKIRKMGMGVEQAIFDPKYGALVQYPSNVIESTMKVLVESARKGPSIAAQALINVSKYIKEIHKVDERLKDLMADIISSMKSQISFLTPVIAGIVVGITSMITTVLGSLSGKAAELTEGTQGANIAEFTAFFGEGIPTFYFQIIVGLYVVQIIYLLTILVNSIENGEDKLNERYLLGINMIKGTIIYCIVSLIIILMFNYVASIVINTTI